MDDNDLVFYKEPEKMIYSGGVSIKNWFLNLFSKMLITKSTLTFFKDKSPFCGLNFKFVLAKILDGEITLVKAKNFNNK